MTKLSPDFNIRTLAHSMYLRTSAAIDKQCAELKAGQTLAVSMEFSGADGSFVQQLRFKICEGSGPFDLGPGDWSLYRRLPDLTPPELP
jgi:hypothetical protein